MPAGTTSSSIVVETSLVDGFTRETVRSAAFATQTAPAPTATAVGPSPTRIGKFDFDAGSIQVTASSFVLATQTAPAPPAIPAGVGQRAARAGLVRGSRGRTAAPWSRRRSKPRSSRCAPRSPPAPGRQARGGRAQARRVDACERRVPEHGPDRAGFRRHARTRVVDGVLRHRARARRVELRIDAGNSSSRPCTTQTAPRPTAVAVGVASSEIVFTTRRVFRSMRLSDSSSMLPTHTEPSPAASYPGLTPTGTVSTTRFVFASMTATEFGGTATEEPSSRVNTSRAVAATRAVATPATIADPRRRCRPAGGCGSSGNGCGQGEPLVLVQDRGLELTEFLARLQPGSSRARGGRPGRPRARPPGPDR